MAVPKVHSTCRYSNTVRPRVYIYILLKYLSRDRSPVVSLKIFPKLPTEPCALGSTQPLKISTRKTPGGEGGRCVKVTTLPPS
jgi:hypothetical protein